MRPLVNRATKHGARWGSGVVGSILLLTKIGIYMVFALVSAHSCIRMRCCARAVSMPSDLTTLLSLPCLYATADSASPPAA
jgi:hypothetical protein